MFNKTSSSFSIIGTISTRRTQKQLAIKITFRCLAIAHSFIANRHVYADWRSLLVPVWQQSVSLTDRLWFRRGLATSVIRQIAVTILRIYVSIRHNFRRWSITSVDSKLHRSVDRFRGNNVRKLYPAAFANASQPFSSRFTRSRLSTVAFEMSIQTAFDVSNERDRNGPTRRAVFITCHFKPHRLTLVLASSARVSSYNGSRETDAEKSKKKRNSENKDGNVCRTFNSRWTKQRDEADPGDDRDRKSVV